MNDDLIDSSRLPLSRKSLLPGAGFFYPDSLDEERAEQQVRETVEGADVVVIADTDADGLGCVALIREMYDAALDVADFEAEIEARLVDTEAEDALDEVVDDAESADTDGDNTDVDEDEEDDAEPKSPVALVGTGPYGLSDALERVAEYADPGVDVYICDLCPDRYVYVADGLEALVPKAEQVRWFDHHQWSDKTAEAVREIGIDLVVGDSDEECTTDVTLRSLDYDFPEHFRELALVTRDHDLWLKEDSRSDDLADYAHWSSGEEYAAIVGAYGADLPEAVEDYIAERRIEKERLVELAVDRGELKEVGPWTVGVTYGRCSQNEVAEGLRQQGADAAIVVKPAGSASIRGTDNFERCHEVAEQVNGGGHPKAAGCKPDIYDDMLDYAQHWTTHGATTKRIILAAFERVAAKEAEEAEEAGAADEVERSEGETAGEDADVDGATETDADGNE